VALSILIKMILIAHVCSLSTLDRAADSHARHDTYTEHKGEGGRG